MLVIGFPGRSSPARWLATVYSRTSRRSWMLGPSRSDCVRPSRFRHCPRGQEWLGHGDRREYLLVGEARKDR